MIVADLLSRAFAPAVDRVIGAPDTANRELNLRQAVDSHRLIDQAVGTHLVERHKILPSTTFERLKAVSQDRNLKLRELAHRIVEEGTEPEWI